MPGFEDPRKFADPTREEWAMITLHTSGRRHVISAKAAELAAGSLASLLETLEAEAWLADVCPEMVRIIVALPFPHSRSIGEVIGHAKDALSEGMKPVLDPFDWRIGSKIMRIWDHEELLRAEQYLRFQYEAGVSMQLIEKK